MVPKNIWKKRETAIRCYLELVPQKPIHAHELVCAGLGGDRLKEGANINRSLLTLGNCINALGEKASRGQFVRELASHRSEQIFFYVGGL